MSRETINASVLAKAREVLADYDAGRTLQVTGDGWLVRFAAALVGQEQESSAAARDGAISAAKMLVTIYGHKNWTPTGLEAQALLLARHVLEQESSAAARDGTTRVAPPSPSEGEVPSGRVPPSDEQ